MSINNITLSDPIVSELYAKTSLIPASNPSIAAKPAPVIPAGSPVATKPVEPRPAETKPLEPRPAETKPVAPKPADPTPVEILPSDPAPYKILGNHRRKVSIIVNSPGAAFLPDDQLGFLSKILEACRMNIGDVAIINHHTTPVVITALRQQLQPQNILLFGVEPTAIRLPINFPEFKLQPYDECTYLSAPPLQQLVANTADAKLLKSKLWVCLKTLFDV